MFGPLSEGGWASRGAERDKFPAEWKFQKARTGERLIASLLQREGWFVIPSYDYSGEDGDKAPRLEGLKAGYVVPDLDVARNGVRRWAEVKTKASAVYTRITKRLEHGIPKRHYGCYLEVQRITGCKVTLFVYEENTGEILFGALDELAKVKREYTGGKMSYGGMVFFPRDAFNLFRRV